MVELRYRAEIDGLRAVAVGLVILHHLGWAGLPGGYVGVDVFFVISGYLITSILKKEIVEGKFSLVNFYKRRVIRLAPAYLAMLGATALAALFLLLPIELIEFSESAVFSAFFSANFHMWRTVGGYFGSQSETTLLLHLWSLAVEEQFYIFWPLTLLVAFRFVPSRLIFPGILIITVVGIALSEWGVNSYLAASYFLLPTRAFELLLGASLAFISYNTAHYIWRSELCVGLGLGLVAYSATHLSEQSLFPGLAAMVPCVGTALVIIFSRSAAPEFCFSRMLASPPMVALGRISYPAYLWHWPIVAFLHIYHIHINAAIGIIVILSILTLSYLTYIYVEAPAKRTMKYGAAVVLFGGFFAPAMMALAFFGTVKANHGFPDRFPKELNDKSAALASYPSKIRGVCNEGNVLKPAGEEKCILGAPVDGRPVDFLLIGDSHANSMTGFMDSTAKRAGLRGYDVTQSNTIYLPGVSRFYEQDGKLLEHRAFKLRNNVIGDIIRNNKYPAVIMAGYFEKHYSSNELRAPGANSSENAFESGLRLALQTIVGSGSKPYVIEGYPTLYGVSHDCPLTNIRLGEELECRTPYSKHQEKFKKWKALLDKLSVEFPSLTVIRLDNLLCAQKWCVTEIQGVPLYKDATHLNYNGSALLGRVYVESSGNPLRNIHDERGRRD